MKLFSAPKKPVDVLWISLFLLGMPLIAEAQQPSIVNAAANGIPASPALIEQKASQLASAPAAVSSQPEIKTLAEPLPVALATKNPDPKVSPSENSKGQSLLPAEPVVTLQLPKEEAPPALAMDKKEETISVDFPNEQIKTIVRNVADLYDLNVVIPESLKGSASIKLHNVTWQQVFQVLLEPLGYIYTVQNNIVRIRGKAEADQEPMTTTVFVLEYADLKDIQNAVAAMIDTKAGGRILTDKRSNSLVITEKPSRIREIEAVVQKLDEPTQQVMIESKFVEVLDNDAKNLGINWQSLSGYQLSASGGLSSSGGSGGSTSGNPGTPAGFISNITTKTTGYDLTGGTRKSLDVYSNVTSAVLSAAQFNIILSALNTLDDTRLVSNPTVVTLNNVEANVTVSTQYPLPQYTYNDQTGTFEVSGFEYKDIGINMKVLPQINKVGFITLNVKPELSSFTNQTATFGGTSTGANAVQLPIIDSRRTQSIVTLNDGYTLAIGGLVNTQSENKVNKVPILGDIPLVGLAFRSTQKILVKRNLIIFITAKSLDPAISTYKDVFDQRVLHEMHITPSDAPGYKIPPFMKGQLDTVEEMRQSTIDIAASQRLCEESGMLSEREHKLITREPGAWKLQMPIVCP